MNKAFRLLWSKAKERWVIVAEVIKGNGGPSPVTVAASAAISALLTLATGAQALPTGGQIAAGQATISSPTAGQMNITQSTNQAIINWNSFGIGKGEAVNIAQPNAASTLLNRVLGNNPSQIFGSLTANGKVFLVNPSGVLFAPGSSVNVGGLVASTLNIKDSDFLAGKYNFFKDGTSGSVTNQGSITGGFVALLGNSVENAGTIITTKGTTGLAAGDAITLGFDPNGYMAIKVDQAAYNAQVKNSGVIEANGGTVVMTASAADALLATVVNNSGMVKATGMVERNGEIVIEGGTVLNSGTLNASSSVGNGGKVNLKASQKIELTDTSKIITDGTKGGTIIVKAEENGTVTGELVARGSLSAQGDGSATSGGFIETSAAKVDIADLSVRTKGGEWLIDPVDVTIQAGGVVSVPNATGTVSPATQPSTVDVATLVTALNNGNSVTIDTQGGTGGNGDITVASAITVAPTTTGAALTLNAYRNININQDITATANSLDLNLNANIGAAGGTNAINKSIDLNGGTLNLGAATTMQSSSSYSTLLKNAAIRSGTGSLLTIQNKGATFDGVDIGTDLNVLGGWGIVVKNNVNLSSGAIVTLAGTTLGNEHSGLFFEGAAEQQLSGSGEVVFAGGGGNFIQPITAGGSLRIGSGITIHGASQGQVGQLGYVLVNEGTIYADNAASNILVTGTNWTNAGTLKATAGMLKLSTTQGYNSTTGALDTVAETNWINAGTLQAGTGTITTNNGRFTNTGTITGAGTLTLGTGILTNQGIITPGGTGATGTLSITGDLLLDTGSNLNIELGGTTAGTGYDVLTVSGAATLGGTLTGSLIDSFTPSGQSFDVISAGTVSGSFTTSALPSGVNGAIVGNIYRLTHSGIVCSGICWDGGASTTNWADAANWTGDALPTSTDVAYLNLVAGVTINLANSQIIKGLNSDANNHLNINSGGALTLLDGATTSTLLGNLTINSGGTLTANGTTSLAALNLASGTLSGSGNVTVTGSFNTTTSSVTLSGSGTFITQGTSTVNMSTAGASLQLNNGKTWINQGALTIDGDDYVMFGMNGTNTLTNAVGATIDLSTSTTTPFYWQNIGGTPIVNNSGTLNQNATGSHSLKATLNNTGTVNVNAGTLTLSHGGTDTGTYAVSSGTTLAFGGGTRTLGAGSNVTGSGTFTASGASISANNLFGIATTGAALNVTSGTLTLSAGAASGALAPLNITDGTLNLNTPTTLTSLTMNGSSGVLNLNTGLAQSLPSLTIAGGSTLNSSDALTINGAFTLSGGILSGSGTFITQGTSTVNMSTAGASLQLNNGKTWINQGSLTIDGDDYITFGMTGTNTLTNAVGATIDLSTSATNPFYWSNTGGTPIVNNSGTLNQNATGSHSLKATLNNTGTVNVNAGTLTLSHGGTDTGTYAVSSGTTLAFGGGTRTLGAGSNVTGSGTFTASGASISANNLFGIATTGAALNVTSGTLTLSAGAASGALAPLNITDGTLNLNTPTTLTSLTMNGSSGVLNLNTGLAQSLPSLTIAGGSTLNTSDALTINGAFTLSGGILSGSGTFITQGTSTVNMSTAGASLQLNNGKTWINQGTLTIDGDDYITFGMTGTNTLTNAVGATIDLSTSTTTPFYWSNTGGTPIVNNSGTLNQNATGSHSLIATLNNTGTVNVNAGTLSISHSFNQSGTLNVASGAIFSRTGGFSNNGTISGSGTITVGTGASKLVNQGIIAPGGTGATSMLTVSGDLQLSTGSNLKIELGGTGVGQFDKLTVNGALSGNAGSFGTLTLSKINGFTYGNSAGDTFQVVSATSGANTAAFTAPSLLRNTVTPTYAASAISLNVVPMVLTVTADNLSKTYGDADPTFTYAASGFDTNTSDTAATALSGLLDRVSGSNAGSYAINLGTLISPLGYVINYTPGTFTINKAHLTVTADNKNRTYGAANPVFTTTVSGFVNGETSATAAGFAGTGTASSTADQYTNAGSATITAGAGTLSSTNYDFTNLVDGTLTIDKAHLTVTADNKNRTYGAANPVFTTTVSGFVNGETSATAAGFAGTGTASSTADQYTNAGSATITAGAGTLSSTNYDFTNLVDGTLTIDKAHLTVTADNKNRTYGAANPVFTTTVSGFVNGATSATAAGFAGTGTASSTADQYTNAGSATITAGAGTLSSTNYDFTNLVDGTLTIDKAHLTVTADNKNRTYGAANPVFTTTVSGFVNGETSATAAGFAGTGTASSTADQYTNAGSATITAGAGTLSSTNYDFTNLVDGTLTIDKAHLTIAANADSKSYDGIAYSGGNGVSYSGFVNGESSAVLTGTLAYTGTSQGATAVGSYTITPQGLSSGNYQISFTDGGLDIMAAAPPPPPPVVPPSEPAAPSSTPVEEPRSPITPEVPAIIAAPPEVVLPDAPLVISASLPVLVPAPPSETLPPAPLSESAPVSQPATPVHPVNAVAPPVSNAGSGGFIAVRPLTIEHSPATPLVYAIPEDAFSHSNPAAVISLVSLQEGCSPLPSWMLFDPDKKIISGLPPKGTKGIFRVALIAKDQFGGEAKTILKIRVGG